MRKYKWVDKWETKRSRKDVENIKLDLNKS